MVVLRGFVRRASSKMPEVTGVRKRVMRRIMRDERRTV